MDKGQGLPITTIVIAALALLVFVILFAITTGRLAIFTGAASECGGVCVASDLKGATADPAALQSMQAPRTGTNPCLNYEQKVQGNYIARGIRGSDGKPIPCEVCCIPTAY
ncbi:MAG: hypothetical protein QW666_03595 [Candidatus Woesearchaeota archaeon]